MYILAAAAVLHNVRLSRIAQVDRWTTAAIIKCVKVESLEVKWQVV